MENNISNKIAHIVTELYSLKEDVGLTRTDPKFGDFATNVALKLSKRLGKNPREVAQKITDELIKTDRFAKIMVAGPGFINLTLLDQDLVKLAQKEPSKSLKGQIIVAEYSDPNPFKVLHAGHLYTTLVGDSVAKLMENAGATVYRVNFGGDVGRHVAMAMWAIIKELGGENPEKLHDIPDGQKLDWISARYVSGNAAFEKDKTAKSEIVELNKKVYALHKNNDHESNFAKIYWTCRDWSYNGFNALYERLDVTPFKKYYPESTVSDLGVEKVKAHVGEVYEESDGAIVFKAEKYGLFTQVFINSEGLPTYAGKDVGLIYHKYNDFNQDRSFIITDVAQKDHLAVVMKSIEQFEPVLVTKTTHFTHGQIKLSGGVKMSSRKGNFLRANDILDAARGASKTDDERVSLGAVKYAFTKQRIGGDIIYEPQESVSLQGNSGPYLQYAYARAQGILSKSQITNHKLQINSKLELGERSLLRKISEYSEVVERATSELMPHHICNYLYELAQEFNRFYEKSKVVGDEREKIRLSLVSKYAEVLKSGLQLLGIEVMEKM